MSIFKNLFRKKPVILELTVIYLIPDEEELQKLTSEYKKKHEEWRYFSEELALPNVKEPSNEIEVPNKEDRGTIQIHLEEIYSINQCENPNYSLVVLYNGMQLIVDYSTENFKKYLKTKGFKIDELKQ